jgi:hypothetical protein
VFGQLRQLLKRFDLSEESGPVIEPADLDRPPLPAGLVPAQEDPSKTAASELFGEHVARHGGSIARQRPAAWSGRAAGQHSSHHGSAHE